MDRQQLLSILLRHLEAGTIEPDVLLPVVRTLRTQADREPPSRRELLAALAGVEGKDAERLRRSIMRGLVDDITRARSAIQRGDELPPELIPELGDLPLHAPLGWRTADGTAVEVTRILRAYQGLAFIESHPASFQRLQEELAGQVHRLGSDAPDAIAPWALLSPTRLVEEGLSGADGEPLKQWLDVRCARDVQAVLGGELPDPCSDESVVLGALRDRFHATEDREQKKRVLDGVLAWPTALAADVLPAMCTESWAQERAALVLYARFGGEHRARQSTWPWWERWLNETSEQVQGQRERAADLVSGNKATLLRHWYGTVSAADHEILSGLETLSQKTVAPLSAQQFLRRFGSLLEYAEMREIELSAGMNPPPPPPAIASRSPVRAEPTRVRDAAVEPESQPPATQPPATQHSAAQHSASLHSAKQAPPPVPAAAAQEDPVPSFWTRHLQSFFAENWFMVAGILMVVVGASILAYFTWDKHWLIRYTIMPTLLGGFTFALAAMGRYLQNQDDDLENAAAMLRGAAILLLPINFMAVTFLWDDTSVPGFVVPAMAALYLAVFGWGLRSWCAAVHPALKWLAGGALLFLNFLVFLRPLGDKLLSVAGQPMDTVLGVGFYVGFLILTGVVVYFSDRVLTAEMAREKRVPWFFGLTLGVTYLQVFAWVHGIAGLLPKAYTYAPMIVLAGGLILYLEGRGLELRGRRKDLEAESFLGFALILLGVLMAAGNDLARIAAFLCAGVIWLHQGAKRDQDVHRWIGLTLLFLAGASIGLHSAFPKAWLAALGLALAAAFEGVSRWLLRRNPEDRTAQITREMTAPVLLLSALVAIVTQWREASPPLWTAGVLVLISAWFIRSALLEKRVRWLYTAMVMLAAALPYLGCVDLGRQTWQGNTMVFGLAVLSWLWIAANAAYRTPLMRSARSTVLWTYGVLAVTAMVVRVLFEPVSPTDSESLRVMMNASGPLLMALALGVATYTSRSIVPAFMAMTIVIILFPELRARFDEELQALGWGTGIGSAVNALWMTGVCFALRGWRRLRDLGPGDKFVGLYPFPLVRTDHKLFTWPLMVSALFLLFRTNTITYARNLPDLPWLTSLALCLAGATWTLQAIYHHRERNSALIGTHLGWISLILGLAHWMTWPQDWPAAQGYFLLLGLALLGLYVLYRLPPLGNKPWARALLSSQIRWVLAAVAMVFSGFWIWLLFVNSTTSDIAPWFVLFLAGLLVWQGVRTGWLGFGSILFFLCGTYVTCHFVADLPTPSLWYLLGIQAVLIGLAFVQRLDEPLRALRQPLSALSSIALLSAGALAAFTGWLGSDLFRGDEWLLIAALGLAAWSTGSSVFVLVAAVASFVFMRGSLFSPLEADGLAVLGAVLIALSFVGERISKVAPRLLRSRLAWNAGPLSHSIPWLPLPSAIVAALALAVYAATPALREQFQWTWIPYVAALTWAAVALRTRLYVLYIGALAALTMGNVFAVRAVLGETLASWGLSDIHTICLGLIVSLAELTGLRQLIRSFRIRTYVGRTCLAIAALVLFLLSCNYVAHPDLGEIRWQRFAISGLMAVLASLYFRAVARNPDPGIEPHVRLCEGLYHYALALAIGCFALLIPVLRTPATAMFALGLPALYFYWRAEMLRTAQPEISARYRNSAGVISYILLGLYVFRPAYQVVFFPSDVVQVFSYHWNAPLVILLGFVMIRLRGLGSGPWLSYFGGLALMTGSYFLLTWLPGLSPFSDPVAAGWCAIVLGHFWMAVSGSVSPLGTAIQRMGGLSEEAWGEARKSWGAYLLFAVHVAVFWGLSSCAPDEPRSFAPLLAGLSTILFHQAYLRQSRWLYAAGGAELLFALHADFFVESTISTQVVAWILLGLWAVALWAHGRMRRPLSVRSTQLAAGALFALCAGHAVYQSLWTPAGLWIMGLATALASLTPQEYADSENAWERFVAGALPFLPVWLTYFALIGPTASAASATSPWPIGMTTLVLVGVAACLRLGGTYLPKQASPLTPGTPRLIDQTRSLIQASGTRMGVWILWMAFGVTGLTQLLHGANGLTVREDWTFLVLYAAIGWEGWTALSKRRPGLAVGVLELAGVGFLITLRALVVQLRPDLWRYEYDVWAALLLSIALAGSKQILDRSSDEIRRAMLPGLVLLPVFSIAWTLGHGLGTDMMLLVVGLHSLLLSYMGKDERESPYRLIAIAGFVAFVLIAFHSKFEFRAIHAYVIPVGLGVLALVQMLRRYMSVETRNRIRAVTHLTMLASAGYYALVDDSHPIAFNVVLFLLCLASMAAGALLRVRLFLVLGFGGLVVSLASIFYRVLRSMEHTARLTSVGLLVLLVGVLFVMGTVYYKTHRDRVNAILGKWQRKIGAWE